jgi:hypothetical protein
MAELSRTEFVAEEDGSTFPASEGRTLIDHSGGEEAMPSLLTTEALDKTTYHALGNRSSVLMDHDHLANYFGDLQHEDPNFSFSDHLHVIGLFLWPACLGAVPVLMPFGNPFAQDGPNSVAINWAYYFWYTPIGWGAVWIKMTLWNAELWDHEFFFPFMRGQVGFFKLNKSIFPVLISTAWAVFLYWMGYQIFSNPVPFGTISFGVPCFVVCFISLYIFVVPSHMRESLHHHWTLLMAYIPFVIWVVVLVTYIGIVWVQTFLVPLLDNKVLYCAANIACTMSFFGINKLLGTIPMDMFLGGLKPSLAVLWTLGYAAMAATMQDWLFPGMPTDFWGLTSFVGMVGVNVVLSAVEFQYETEPIALIEAALHNVCEVISGFAFAFIFTYNAFGPNQDYIYMIDNLDRQQKINAIVMILINFAINTIKLAIMIKFLPGKFDTDSYERVRPLAWWPCGNGTGWSSGSWCPQLAHAVHAW